MSTHQTGNKNGPWKGGRVRDSHGYILVRLYPTDRFWNMADGRGYVYEHRLVAARILGRPLTREEQVCRRDKNQRSNNDFTNLQFARDSAHRHLLQRKPGSVLRRPNEPNVLIHCACGCGATFTRYDAIGRPRKFVNGHNRQPPTLRSKFLEALAHGPMTVTWIQKHTEQSRGAVRAMASTLCRSRIIVRVAHGRYAIKGCERRER